MKGVLVREEIVSFASNDTLIKKLLDKRRHEQPGTPIPKGDSVAIVMGVTFLCELLHDLVVIVNNENEMIFYFTIRKDGSKESQMQTLLFSFKDENTLTTTDERGGTAELKIEKLTPTTLIFAGISSARNMQLCFKKE